MDGGGGGRRPEMRRTMTLSEQLSLPDPAIRDFLKIPQDADIVDGEDEQAAAAAGAGWKPLRDRLRLRRAVGAWQRPPKPTTAAAAHHGPTNSGGGGSSSAANSNNRSNKYNYNPGEAAAAFSRTYSRAPSLRAPSLRGGAGATTGPSFSRVASTRVGPTGSSRSSSRRPLNSYDFRDADERRHEDDGEEEDEEDEEEEEEEEEEKEEEEEAPAAQMSLMALLQTDDGDEWDEDEDEEDGGGGRKKGGGGGGGEGDDEEEEGEGREEEMVHVCCVCMVRHKGAAFIPCGHTFCRLCSRELWVSRGNCPLCNGFIQEILDIF